MGHLVDEQIREGQVSKETFVAYLRYLETNAASLAEGVREFATASFRYDSNDHRCLHDAWVERLEVFETATGSRRESRRLNVRLSLLGAYHDGIATFEYKNVTRYMLSNQEYFEYREYREHSAHGDLLVEDFSITPTGQTVHSFLFRWGAIWTIESDDIRYTWTPTIRQS